MAQLECLSKEWVVEMQWRLLMEHKTWKAHAWCWQRQNCEMGPLLPYLNILGNKKSLIPIISILQRKLGKILTFIICPHLILYLHRTEIVCWVTESKRPFKIVKDWGFQNLMKTGRLEYHILSPETVSCDVRNVFVNVHKCIMNMLQVSNTKDSFFLIKRLTSGIHRNIMVL